MDESSRDNQKKKRSRIRLLSIIGGVVVIVVGSLIFVNMSASKANGADTEDVSEQGEGEGANGDDQGEKELVDALRRAKAQGCTLVVITHRTMVLQCVDKILVLRDGTTFAYGPRDQVLAQLAGKAQAAVQSAASPGKAGTAG